MSVPIGVAQVVAAFAACRNRHGMDAFAALFAPDAEFANVAGRWWKGCAGIGAAHEFAHAMPFRHLMATRIPG
ncbi:hypothetical protein [Rhodanobacter denitrificans]|nr:hypothetical protein [Rhodanobacter denitrificans]